MCVCVCVCVCVRARAVTAVHVSFLCKCIDHPEFIGYRRDGLLKDNNRDGDVILALHVHYRDAFVLNVSANPCSDTQNKNTSFSQTRLKKTD